MIYTQNYNKMSAIPTHRYIDPYPALNTGSLSTTIKTSQRYDDTMKYLERLERIGRKQRTLREFLVSGYLKKQITNEELCSFLNMTDTEDEESLILVEAFLEAKEVKPSETSINKYSDQMGAYKWMHSGITISEQPSFRDYSYMMPSTTTTSNLK